MSAPPPARILLLDVEGTTTSVSFVYDVLFPFARAGVEEFLRASLPGQATVRDDVARLAAERRVESEAGAPPSPPPPTRPGSWTATASPPP